MTPTLDAFAQRLSELRQQKVVIAYSPGPPPVATIAAKDHRVGDLNIYDDGDELTVDLGTKHHTHISAYNYDHAPEADRLGMVAQDAAEFVNDVMRDRIIITVRFNGDRCIGSSHYYVEENRHGSTILSGLADMLLSGDRTETYLWSGPVD
jgi:hypothetical protein